MYAHKTAEGLKKYLPADILPEEYGGTEYSLAEINGKYFEQ